MRVNIYAEELTDKVEIVTKGEFVGVRFYLELPIKIPTQGNGNQIVRGPSGDESAAVTFWGDDKKLRETFGKAIMLTYSDNHRSQFANDLSYFDTNTLLDELVRRNGYAVMPPFAQKWCDKLDLLAKNYDTIDAEICAEFAKALRDIKAFIVDNKVAL